MTEENKNRPRRETSQLERALDHRFKRSDLLRQALTHRSYAHEHGDVPYNEPLEFLGDAVLGFLVAERVYRRRPPLNEGQMTRLRSVLVDADSLAALAEDFGVGEELLLGRGEEATGGRTKKNILADAFEAVVGALFLDGGIRPVRRLVARLFGDAIADADHDAHTDAKTELQEYSQAQGWSLPEYRLAEQRGPAHAREFVIEVAVNGHAFGCGAGSSKKRAEQTAARAALAALRDGGAASGRPSPIAG